MQFFKYKFHIAIILFALHSPNAFAQGIPNDDCADAIELPMNESCVYSSYTSIGADSEPESVAPDPWCGVYIGGDVWFTFTAPESGMFAMKRTNTSAPTFFAFYTGTCGNFELIQCSQQSNIMFNDPELGGETIYIRSYAFFSNLGSDFDICVVDESPPANESCSEAVQLTVGETCDYSEIFNNQAASEEPGIAPTPSCGQYQGADVWFTFVLPENGQVEINRMNQVAGNFYFSVYEGSCGDFTELGCSPFPGQQLVISDLSLAGETLYIRVFQRNSTHAGNFQLCLVNGDCNGIPGGGAFIDDCGECVGGTTGLTPCDNIVQCVVNWNASCGDETALLEWEGTGSETGSADVNINQDGLFSVEGIEAGIYDFYLKRDGFLRKRVPNFPIVAAGNEIDFGTLTPGDLTGNNAVGISDYSQFSTAYGLTITDENYNDLSDFNCDGSTNIQDFSVFGIAYGTTGD